MDTVEVTLDRCDLEERHENLRLLGLVGGSLLNTVEGVCVVCNVDNSYFVASLKRMGVKFREDYGSVYLHRETAELLHAKLRGSLRDLPLCSISCDAWESLFDGHVPEFRDQDYGVPLTSNAHILKFASTFGVPHRICHLKLVTSHISDRPSYYALYLNCAEVLLDVFKQVVIQNPYDSERFTSICEQIQLAYVESTTSIYQRRLKTDYELFELGNYKEMAHVRDGDSLDFDRSLPRFWFDPMEFSSLDETELRSKLALSKYSHEKLTHVIVCGFPAGAMFLKCRVEPQAGQEGGGSEYLYLRNACQSVFMIRVAEVNSVL